MNDIDASSKPEDSQTWYNECPVWKKYGSTELTRKLVAGEASNYGVVMWATNEDQYTDRDEKYFYSSEYGTSTYRPKLVVKYTSSPLVEYTYNAVGQPTKVLYATDLTNTNTYDPYRQWFTSKKYKDAGSTEKCKIDNIDYNNVGKYGATYGINFVGDYDLDYFIQKLWRVLNIEYLGESGFHFFELENQFDFYS